jgi:hypothetical protein
MSDFCNGRLHGQRKQRPAWIRIAPILLALIFLPCGSASGQGRQKTKLECKSENYRRAVCSVGGPIEQLRLTKKKSSSPCIEGTSYGYSDKSVWVDSGCAAQFEVTYRVESADQPDPGDDRPWWERLGSSDEEIKKIRCSSENYGRNICVVEGKVRSVDLRQQRSRAGCEEGVSYGYYDDFVWVDKGCEADFEVRFTPRTGWGGPPSSDPAPRRSTGKVRFTCKSTDYNLGVCYVAGPIIDVRLRKAKSRASCVKNDSYGFRNDLLWVSNGCEGDFEVTFRPDNSSPDPGWEYSTSGPKRRTVKCKSDNYRRERCDVGGVISTVRLRKTKSRAPCTADSTYGFEFDEIWVNQGCEGEFEITYFPRP